MAYFISMLKALLHAILFKFFQYFEIRLKNFSLEHSASLRSSTIGRNGRSCDLNVFLKNCMKTKQNNEWAIFAHIHAYSKK